MDPVLLLDSALRKDNVESVGFLNDLVAHMWPFINTAVSHTVKEVVEPMFEEMLPTPFKSTRFLKIDLGTVPMKFDNADVVQRTKNSVRLDMDIHWDGHSDIELKSPLVGVYGVESVKIKGRASVVFKPLLPVLPVVGALQVSFVNPPFVDLDFTGIADVADTAFLRTAIRKIIARVVNSILVLPNRIFVPISPHVNFDDAHIEPEGFLRLTIESGRGFKPTGRLVKDIPDVYVQIAMGGEELARSATVNNSCEPHWEGQCFDFLLSDTQQVIRLLAWDDDLAGDDSLGGAIFPVYHLLDAPEKRREIPLKTSDGPTGASITIKAEVRPFTGEKSAFDIVRSTAIASVAKKIVKAGHVGVGLLIVGVARAFGIPRQPGLEPYCKVTVGEDHSFQTGVVVEAPLVDPCAPVYNSAFRVPLTPALFDEKPGVKIELCSDGEVLGVFEASFDDVVAAPGMMLRENADMECGAKLKLSVRLLSCA